MTPPGLCEYLAVEGRKLILARFRPDSCVASTRVAFEVVKRLGGRAYAQAVHLQVVNRPVIEAMAEGRTPEDALRRGGVILRAEGSDRITVGEGSQWHGHLVLVVDDSVLLDMSADQFHRPERGIDARAFAVPFSGWPVGVPFGDAAALYEPVETRVYRQGPDWVDRLRWSDLVDALAEGWREWSTLAVDPRGHTLADLAEARRLAAQFGATP